MSLRGLSLAGIVVFLVGILVFVLSPLIAGVVAAIGVVLMVLGGIGVIVGFATKGRTGWGIPLVAGALLLIGIVLFFVARTGVLTVLLRIVGGFGMVVGGLMALAGLLPRKPRGTLRP